MNDWMKVIFSDDSQIKFKVSKLKLLSSAISMAHVKEDA